MRSILYISGTRADYGPARSLLRAIEDDAELELKVLVTGMHLDPAHGETWKEIEKDGLTISGKIFPKSDDNSILSMVDSIASELSGMSRKMIEIKPDVVLVLGDRGEMLAGAMSAAFLNIPVAHLCGGSMSGSIDNSIRHAITKFSHFHFPPFEEEAERIIQMGEPLNTVQAVGFPGGDISSDAVISKKDICDKYGLSIEKPYILVIFHPDTHSHDKVEGQIRTVLSSIADLEIPALLANPNNDAGGKIVLNVMQELSQKHSLLKILPPPRSREMFASIMANAEALVGNSSCAVSEAMSVALPVVNIGERQKGREHLAVWLNSRCEYSEIKKNIIKAIGDKDYRNKLDSFSEKMRSIKTNDLIISRLKKLDLEMAKHPKPFHDLVSISASRRSYDQNG